jgi:hypothetical protein
MECSAESTRSSMGRSQHDSACADSAGRLFTVHELNALIARRYAP